MKQQITGWRGISMTICKSSAPHSRQITTSAPYHSIFYTPDADPDAQPIVLKHRKQIRLDKGNGKNLL